MIISIKLSCFCHSCTSTRPLATLSSITTTPSSVFAPGLWQNNDGNSMTMCQFANSLLSSHIIIILDGEMKKGVLIEGVNEQLKMR